MMRTMRLWQMHLDFLYIVFVFCIVGTLFCGLFVKTF
jgi:hypothetical protein